MSSIFRLSGVVDVGPSAAVGSNVLLELAETLGLRSPALPGTYVLSTDAPVSVGFGALSSAGVVLIRSTSKIRARLTSTDGAQQAIPVDTLLVLLARGVPVTAIDLTRVVGVTTEVEILLGECS